VSHSSELRKNSVRGGEKKSAKGAKAREVFWGFDCGSGQRHFEPST
jgi:hypothetical protein